MINIELRTSMEFDRSMALSRLIFLEFQFVGKMRLQKFYYCLSILRLQKVDSMLIYITLRWLYKQVSISNENLVNPII